MARKMVLVFAVGAVVVFAAAQLATAQSQEEWREAQEGESQSLVLDQSYHGTTPGGGNTLPRVEEIKNKPGNWVTWPGFQMRMDGGSRIFIQTTKSLDYVRRDKSNRLTLDFKNTSIHLYNNRHPLVTIHFNTPVRRAYVQKKRKNARLVIEQKVAAEPSISQYSDSDGYHYLIIDYPPGSYPMGGDWGNRPSYSGYGTPQTGPIIDDEVPPQQ